MNQLQIIFFQLKLLIWKSFLIQKRNKLATLFELFVPILFTLALLPIRSLIKSEYHLNTTIFEPFDLDNFGDSFVHYLNTTFAFYPNSSVISNNIINKVSDELKLQFRSFKTETEMLDYLAQDYTYHLFGIGILNDSVTNFTYELRFSNSPRYKEPLIDWKDWKTKILFPSYEKLGPRDKGSIYGGEPGYYAEGFLRVQKVLDYALISEYDSNVNRIDLRLQRFPYGPYQEDSFVIILIAIFPYIIQLSFMSIVIFAVKTIVHEKESGLKEAMKIMGMKTWVYWLSWYIKIFIMLLPSVIVMSICFKIKIPNEYGGQAAIINKTEFSIYFLLMLIYASSLTTFIMMCTTFFKKSTNAAAGAGFIHFITYLPHIYVSLRYEKLNYYSKILLCLVNNLALCLGVHFIGLLEGSGTGLDYTNWYKGIYEGDSFSFVHSLIMMIFNHFVHFFFLYYFDNLFPGDHGIAKPWYFIFKSNKKTPTDFEKNNNQADSLIMDTNFENESIYSGKKIGIKIENLVKEYNQFGITKKAVDKLSLNIYSEQITVLLGQNGAGKSTTISMITGVCEPTSGSISINNHDLKSDLNTARLKLGYCPQHNLLFDDLTVYEHLKFFSQLKQNFFEPEISEMLKLTNLFEKKDLLAKTLSGGMKRKLSLAIAFIGGSQIVILDEPSSGLDPRARHSTWTLLKKFKAERKCTILMTTHFMDEADYLADRIAILSKGRLKCYGSPLFLKSLNGAEYTLVLTRKAKMNNKNNKNEFNISSDKINQLVKEVLPNSSLVSNISSELKFKLSSKMTSKYPDLFKNLEKLKDQLGIISIGLNFTNLEQVFLRIEDENEDEKTDLLDLNKSSKKSSSLMTSLNRKKNDQKGLLIGSNKSDLLNSKFALLISQFNALIIKKFIHTLRNKQLILTQILFPIFVLSLNLFYIKYAVIKPDDSPALEINISAYDYNYSPYNVIGYNSFINSISNYYRNGLLKNEKVIPFQLNDTSLMNFCPTSRNNIDSYLDCISKISYKSLNKEHFVATELKYHEENEKNKNEDIIKIIGHFNNQPYHVPPLVVNLVTNSLLKHFTNSSDSSITVINKPLPRNFSELIDESTNKGINNFRIASGLNFGLSFLIASFSIFLIKENASGAKHIQFLKGCSPILFWLSGLIWDMVNYMISVSFVFILLFLFNVNEIIGELRWLYTLIILILYGLAHIPQVYLLSLKFNLASTGFAIITGWNIISSQLALITIQILSIPNLGASHVVEYLESIFIVLFPNFSMGQSLIDMYDNSENLKLCIDASLICRQEPNPCCKYSSSNKEKPCGDYECFNWNKNYWSWSKPGLSRYALAMSIQFIVQFALLILIETGSFRKLRYGLNKNNLIKKKAVTENKELNSDVIDEEKRIEKLLREKEKNFFIVSKLFKCYSNLTAVKGISFSIDVNECFGLLGVNGAGKTTTFKMITGDEIITSGEVYLNNISIKKDLRKYQKKLGYCPQSDPLIDQMTVLENLLMYCRLKGIKSKLLMQTCLSLIDLLDLNEYKDKMCFTLSGGNKRKLSVAVALVGSPYLILLDEPTSGMDPKARRKLWNTLNVIRNAGKSIVLTTHSMDEIEALSTKVGIMVKGQLKCIGSLQNIKSNYGEGFTLLLKLTLKPDDKDNKSINNFIQFISSEFKKIELKENRNGFLNFHYKTNSIHSFSNIFKTIETNKEKYSIEYYSVTQTNLEQIFLNFNLENNTPQLNN